MSQTITLRGVPKVPGAYASQTLRWQGDASYPASTGYVVTPANVNMIRFSRIVSVTPNTAAAAAWDPIIVPTYDATGDFIVSFAVRLVVSTTAVELANGVTAANADFNIVVEGN